MVATPRATRMAETQSLTGSWKAMPGVARSGVTVDGRFMGAPILKNDAQWVGPGHGSVVVAHGDDFFFHHAWPTNGAGVRDPNAGRHGLVDRIVWANGWPTFASSASAAGLQPWP